MGDFTDIPEKIMSDTIVELSMPFEKHEKNAFFSGYAKISVNTRLKTHQSEDDLLTNHLSSLKKVFNFYLKLLKFTFTESCQYSNKTNTLIALSSSFEMPLMDWHTIYEQLTNKEYSWFDEDRVDVIIL